MARMCAVNARNTFSEYQKYLRDEKYVSWNREKVNNILNKKSIKSVKKIKFS